MPGRPHAERLRADLDEIRTELIKAVGALTPEELDWAPKPDMKTFKQLLQEIGAMEKVTIQMAIDQTEADWGAIWQYLDKDTVGDILSAMAEIRAETTAYLSSISEETFEEPVALPEEWQGYFHLAAVEPEELIRWILRHEYYHLGQLVTYQWQRGFEPTSEA